MADFLTACASAAPQFRWTPAGNLHLTVRFIGNVDRTLVEAIADRLAARSQPAFDLELDDLGTFGHRRHVRVVWQGLRDGAEAVAALVAQVEAQCATAGLVAEKRPFQAHMTLARARPRDGADLARLPEPPRVGRWRASELVLYASRLSRTGATYEPLRVVKLD
ncbi:MAG TPA: RNA 2',3'-cyclic phosphodiesterase [Methylomirabilota bacterium]|nr:RNA 2',3'-cyclic phosphodiesterase [Methylomirabilota bacterium]